VIRSPALLPRVLLIHLATGCSLAETALRVRQAGWACLSAVAVFERLQAAEGWLNWLCQQLWRRRQGRACVAVGKRRVRLLDATIVREQGRTGSQWRVHYSLDLQTLACRHFELTDLKAGERFRRLQIEPGELILGDRGYGKPPQVAYVRQERADVLVRINLSSFPLFDEAGRRINILARLRRLSIAQVGDWPAWVHSGGQAYAGRLVAVRRGRRAARLAQKRLRRRASQRQKTLSARTLESARYVFVWTSLVSETGAEVLEWYRLRWQIELAIKRMKSILGLGQRPKRADASSRAWLHGKLLVALLVEDLMTAAETFSPWGYPLEEEAPQPLA
jgi:hypothetical protein